MIGLAVALWPRVAVGNEKNVVEVAYYSFTRVQEVYTINVQI